MSEDKLKRMLLYRDIPAHPGAYVLPVLALAAGAVCGVLSPAGFFGAVPAKAGEYMETYLALLRDGGFLSWSAFSGFLAWNGGLLLLILLSGCCAAGPAFILFCIFLRGFSFAFVDFYLACSREPGTALLIAVLLPQSLALLVLLRAGKEALSVCRARTGPALAAAGRRARCRQCFGIGMACLPALLIAAGSQAGLTDLALRLAGGPR